ncbi:beta-lactamase/transpeptidase-like protein [Aspergillus spectabilis]
MSSLSYCTPDCQPALAHRLTETISQIHQIKEISQAPSISFGVVHQGKIVPKGSIGYRDVEAKLDANPDTIYYLILHEDFNPRGNPRIAAEADIINLLRHSIRITDPFNLYVVPCGCHLQDSEAQALIPLLNVMPTANPEGQRFNSALDFIHSRLLQPLGMDRTVLTMADIHDDNVAFQYTMLNNGTLKRLPTEQWPFNTNTFELPGSGMGSSLNDMLTWCISVLATEKEETERDTSNASVSRESPNNPTITTMPQPQNPLKQITCVRRGYWTRPPEDPNTSGQAAFGTGWIRMTLPTSMLAAFSGSRQNREAPWKLHLGPRNFLGLDFEKEKRVIIGHTGGAIGGIATVWTFPETQSAVCTIVNMRALGDASDFAAQALIQALFDLEPRVDLIPWVRKQAELNKSWLTDGLLKPKMANRRVGDYERDREAYVGEYKVFDDLFTLSISFGSGREGEGRLAMTFNHVERSRSELVFFRSDTYSLFTGNLDYWAAEYFPYKDYRETLLKFELGDAEEVLGLWWVWDTDEERAWMRDI